MGVTPNRGFPYPEPTDQRRLGADQIKALAMDLDTKITSFGMVGSIPNTTITLSANGWTGSVVYKKFGDVVTVWVNASKSSWAASDNILPAGSLPASVRPNTAPGYQVGQAFDAAVSLADRQFWLHPTDGGIYAATAGTNSIYGVVTYQVPSVENSVAAQTFSEGTLTAGAKTTVGVSSKAFLRAGMVTVNVNVTLTSAMVAGDLAFTVPTGFTPADTIFVTLDNANPDPPVATRWHLLPSGGLQLQGTGVASGVILRGSFSYPAAVPAALAGQATITGEIKEWAGATIPPGYLLCNGGSFSSVTYPELAAVLGDTYGVHSGTTYYLPKRASILPDTDWIYPTFASGWSAFDAFHIAPRYRRLNGVVYLQGLAKGPSGSTIFTLPAGFRPAPNPTVDPNNKLIAAQSSDSTTSRVDVFYTGAVAHVTGASGYVSLFGLEFPADDVAGTISRIIKT